MKNNILWSPGKKPPTSRTGQKWSTFFGYRSCWWTLRNIVHDFVFNRHSKWIFFDNERQKFSHQIYAWSSCVNPRAFILQYIRLERQLKTFEQKNFSSSLYLLTAKWNVTEEEVPKWRKNVNVIAVEPKKKTKAGRMQSLLGQRRLRNIGGRLFCNRGGSDTLSRCWPVRNSKDRFSTNLWSNSWKEQWYIWGCESNTKFCERKSSWDWEDFTRDWQQGIVWQKQRGQTWEGLN